jgi:hypothetical protein
MPISQMKKVKLEKIQELGKSYRQLRRAAGFEARPAC